MESSQAATVSVPPTIADAAETFTTSTSTPSAAVNNSSPEAATSTPAAVTTDSEQSEPKIEQVTPADMEAETSPSPVSLQEAVDPLAVPLAESPEISTTSVEAEKSIAESTNKKAEQTVEKNPLTDASNDGSMSERFAKPSTSSTDPVAAKKTPSEASESLPTSTSSPAGDPTPSSSNAVEEETSTRRSPPARTPPPVVESSTASPEKHGSGVSESSARLDGPTYSTTSTVDSSSSSSDKTSDSNVGAVEGPSSNCNVSDNVNSISNDCSSTNNNSNSNEAESQVTATDNDGSTSQEANATTTTDPSDLIRSSTSEIAVPMTTEVSSNAVIEKESPENKVDSNTNGVVIVRQEAGKDEQQPSDSLPHPGEANEGCEENSLAPNDRSATDDLTSRQLSGQEESGEKSSNSSDGPTNEESQSIANSTCDANAKEQREETVLECRESAAVPPEPDPAEFSRDERSSDKSDSRTMSSSLSTGATGRADYHHHVQQQQPPPPVSARNPLQFTEVANDEVELKVDGGHLLDRVIKLSLLKGLQDSGKRLAKSSLIISGAGANVGEGANGEATLATTSSLSKAKSAAAGLRLIEEHKTTPPALVANGGAAGNDDVAQVPVKELASSTKEAADSPHQTTTQSGGRIRHSSDTTVSSSPSGELDAGVRSSSNSSLDFREEERSAQGQEVPSPASSSLEASSSRSSAGREPGAAVPNSSNEHLPVKARKPQYYASIPDFSKQQFSSTTSTVPTSTTTTTKSLAQLHMKTPDFSCLASGPVPSSQTSPSSTTTNSTISTVASMNVRTTSELKISNPDFTKGFAVQHAQYDSTAHGNYPPAACEQQQPGNSSPYVSQDTFSKLIKERNYIADLQLKNPPPTQNQASSEGQLVVKRANTPNEYPPSRVVMVDTTSSVVGGVSAYGHATQTPNSHYRRPASVENGMEQEPKAHVIQKNSESASAQPPPPTSQPLGGHHAPKTWNPPEFSSKHFTQAPPPSHGRPGAASNGAGPSSTSPSSRDPSPAPSSTSPHQPSYGQQPGGLVSYAGKAPHPTGPTSVVGSERIIVNNVRTYYPEASVPPSSAAAPNASAHSHTTSSSLYTSLPKVKDPEFRMDHSKEQLLLQEGTIVTVKQPYSNQTVGRAPIPAAAATRSPSVERREAQMMQNSQDILYRDYKQHKKPTSTVVMSSSSGGGTRPTGPPQGGPMDRRSPYDPSGYYSQSMHQHRPPVVPPQAGGGLMHPPPPNWPAPGPHHASHHQLQRGPAGPASRNSPQDNGASPVSSPAPSPASQHHYQHHPHQGPYYGQYKNAPSPVSGSTYGSSSSPSQPQGAGGKYPPQQHYAASGSGPADRRLEVLDRSVGSANYKGLDYNMEQKFAEVYQAHQAKEKQAAAEAAHAAASNSSRQGPRHGHGPGGGTSGSPGISSTPGVPTKGPVPPYGPAGYEQYHPYYQHSQATPSPTSTPSPVPSPHHRKYSGPPSRDPSPLGQQPQQPPPHHRYSSSEPLYHVPPGGGPPTMYAMHSGPPKPNEQGVPPSQPPGPVTSYYQSQPSSSSSYSSASGTGYPNRPHHAGAVVSPSQHHNATQQSVISGNPYDRYGPNPYATGGSSQSAPGGQQQAQQHQQQQQQQQQQQAYQIKPSLPYPPSVRLQGPPPLQPAPPSSAAPSAVIHPPVTGSKNIPVRVIATAPPASAIATSAGSQSNTVPTVQTHGAARSMGQSSASTSTAALPPAQGTAAEEGSGRQAGTNSNVAATTPVIIAPKRESPLDLSVKTIKTKADSTGCDDYAMSASNSSISSSSSSNSSNSSNAGNGRPREVVPKVDFSPNFQKHIPPRNAASNFAPTAGAPALGGGRPSEPHLPTHPAPSPTRHVSVISPVIPPGYDKKTDAYLSANYRAVGGPLVSPAYQYPAARSGPMPPGEYEGSSPAAPGSAVASASSKSVYYPPAGPEYGRPSGKSGSGSIVTGQAVAPLPVGSSNSRQSNPSAHGALAGAGQSSSAGQPRTDDPRIEDRKFVESMLKKKTSPSSDVMADLQAGKFPTRIPQGLVPKKRAAAAAAAAAAAEAALAKSAPVPPVGTNSTAPVPTPAKVAKYEVPQASRTHTVSQGSPHGAPPFDGCHPNQPHGPLREGPYPNYGPVSNPGGHHYPTGSKRPAVPTEVSNGPAVHPSVITTNYHHHPQAVLQQQQQQQQQYVADARYYQHHSGMPAKTREDHVIPVYHQPHLRGGSAVPPYTTHVYGGYSKEDPNTPHLHYPQHHSDTTAYHKESSGAMPFRYGDSLKPPSEHSTVPHMQSHIHYTGGSAGPMVKVPHQPHLHQQPPHIQPLHHLSTPQSVPTDAQMGVSQYPPNVHPSHGPAQHHRGADQSVISKLRTSLEQKEYEKQRINQLRKQPTSGEPIDEERPRKATIATASPTVAASTVPSMHEIPSPSSRFRTKGELKGYTPLPPTPNVASIPVAPRSIDDFAQLPMKKDGADGEEEREEGDEKKRSIVPPADVDGASALDILDWGSACNEFVEQLQTGKKRGRRKRTAAAGSADLLETIPLAEGSTTDLSAIPKEVLNSARSPHRLKSARNGSESSSDEDKPLLLLRQQSQQQQKNQEQRLVDGKGQVQLEKAARNVRERQRFELEQKHEAKLGRSSSTDSETARTASATAQRAKARVRKLRHRSSVAPALSLKSSEGDGDVTADGGEEDSGKPSAKRVPNKHIAPSAKRKRIRAPDSRSPSSSGASSLSSESSEPEVKKPESEMPRKRGRPKGTGARAKRAQQSSNSRCQTGAIKQEPNENSDLSSDEESRAVRTPHKNGSSAANSDSVKKRGGDATSGSGAGGPSGGGGNGGGKAQHGGNKVNESSTCNGGSQKERNTGSAAARKKFIKTRTNSRSKAELSSQSSSSGSTSSSSSEEEAEEAEETMTRSRSKLEAERRRSNSKVLRNDKIVENCPNPAQNQRTTGRNRVDSERTPSKKTKTRKLSAGEPTAKRSKSRVLDSDSDGPKPPGESTAVPRKRTRQASKNALNSSAGSGESAESSSEEEGGPVDVTERLRSRKVAKKLTEEPPARKQSTSSATKGVSRRESTTSGKGSESSAKKKGNGSSGPSTSSALAGVKKSLKELNQSAPEAPDHFYPGWEKELYEYKRSLKVPPELITIDGGLYMHRISTSLPDLDSPHHSDGSETFSEIVKKLNQRDVGSAPPKRFKTKAAAKQHQERPIPGTSASYGAVRVKEEEQTRQERKKIDDNEKFSSIIELLHRRCIAAQGAKPTVSSSSARGKGAKGAGKGSNNTSSSESTKPKQEYELLPTPGAESESLFSKNSKKKKSLFDTAILKSRTRTEQKAMQSKEMIREVFGGDGERPQSAPPLSCGPQQLPPLFEEGLRNVTYDEKYNELMRNVDRIVGELDGGGGVVTTAAMPPTTTKVKQEPPEDDEEEEEEAEDEEDDDDTQDGSVRMKDSERDTPSIASERGERELPGTPLSFNGGAAISNGGANGTTASSGQLIVPPAPKKRGRGHRTSRRKGSSGFDYIRKKKKPSQQHNHGSHGNQQHGASGVNGVNGSMAVRKVTAFENMEGKDETHISKEIRSWVLNKGVGESVMHKAARLGYTDVIVYCLERLDMDPDLKDNAGYTPLHEACAKGHLDIANYLLQYGASHSEPAPSGMRPLHEAVENSFVEIVRLLLAFGADPMLATYTGMTPMQLAESDDMTLFLEDHLKDVQSMAPNKMGWKFDGPWKIHDPEESGCNVFSELPGFEKTGGLTSLNTSGTSSSGSLSSASSKQCDSNSNIMHYEVGESAANTPTDTDGSARKRNGILAESTLPTGLRNGKIKREIPKQEDERLPNGVEARTKLLNGVNQIMENGEQDLELHDGGSEDGEEGEMIFEYEEADRPLPPLYVLKDEYNERWMLMSDLCNFLKFKSKEAVLRQICPNNSPSNQRELIREMKIEEFLTRANCLQLLCAGEKLNIHASKVVLVKYNDSVKSLLQVQSYVTRI
uniref:ANK_REP_REGION domain-containing protein n=1 Tax=Anopheles christyi TaxID=43041 RepID=A0A182JND8_9DIPT